MGGRNIGFSTVSSDYSGKDNETHKSYGFILVVNVLKYWYCECTKISWCRRFYMFIKFLFDL